MNIWDKERNARRFVQERGIPYSIGQDADESISTAYDVQGTPTTYFIGKDGKIKAVHEGAMSEEELIQGLEALLKSR